jgi:hypothetical protein
LIYSRKKGHKVKREENIEGFGVGERYLKSDTHAHTQEVGERKGGKR